jgi:hypothetical protein
MYLPSKWLIRLSHTDLILSTFDLRTALLPTYLGRCHYGTGMTYSATTTVHALALFTQFGWTDSPRNIETSKAHGDFDLFGTFPVLLAAAIMFPPILDWSTNVRRDKAHIIMILWGMLCFATLVPVTVYSMSNSAGNQIHLWNFESERGQHRQACRL